ncbi:hypothetical protein MRX96_026679 [Rhipicephalus microplus]
MGEESGPIQSPVIGSLSAYPKEDFANTVEEIYGGRGDYGGSGHDGRDDASDAARATISGGGGDASDVVKTTGSDSNTPPPLRSRTPFANDSNTPPPLRSRKPITSVAPAQSVSQVWTTTPEIPTSATHPITTTPATTTVTTRAPTVDPNTKRPLPLGSLICTVQTPFAVTFRHVPPDGMCSIILAYPFYTYLGVTLDPEYYEHDGVQNILDVAAQQKHTEYGIGIDF